VLVSRTSSRGAALLAGASAIVLSACTSDHRSPAPARPLTPVTSLGATSLTSAAVTGSTSASTSGPRTTPSTTATGTSGTEAVGAYLAVARTAFPSQSTSALVVTGRQLCIVVRARSVHDAVGSLAGQLTNQALANQVVRAAITAYCPDVGGR
jgi:Protein of unknown function (DUF732)